MSESLPVPFGKYKGQPIEVLATDPQYTEWLASQGWVRERFPQLYTVIINNFGETADTPEHNDLQARFLDEVLVIQAGIMAEPRVSEFYHRTFEPSIGGDVLLEFSWFKWKKHPTKPGGPWDGDETWFNVLFELKPSIGDDYPSILRAISRIPSSQIEENHRVRIVRCVLFEAYTGTTVSLEKVKAIFADSGVRFLSLEELQSFPTTFPDCPPPGGWEQQDM